MRNASNFNTEKVKKMSNQAVPLPAQQTITDLDTASEVTIGKIGVYNPVVDMSEALARVGGDSKQLLGLVNDALKSRARQEMKTDPTGWYVIPEGEAVQSLDPKTAKPFTGTIGDRLKVNKVILELAKAIAGYDKSMTPEQKEQAKAIAFGVIKSTPTAYEGFKKNCALKVGEVSEDSTDTGSDE